MSSDEAKRCAFCGLPVPVGKSGRPLKYCKPAHRFAAARAAKAGVRDPRGHIERLRRLTTDG